MKSWERGSPIYFMSLVQRNQQFIDPSPSYCFMMNCNSLPKVIQGHMEIWGGEHKNQIEKNN
jgi:hypothetical protein